MPEGPEVRIMSDFINQKSKNKIFKSAFHVKKGNIPSEFEEIENNFTIFSRYYGKKIILDIKSENFQLRIYIFMGMSGSWKWVDTKNWSDIKYTRLRFDTLDGDSLLLFGGYLGPKYNLYENFKNASDGPDIIQDFEKFEKNLKNNLNSKDFQKPIYELLLNQKYFAGVGNYLRSTIIYYADVNPFIDSKKIIEQNPNFPKICHDIIKESYNLNGGQLKDWNNPFEVSSEKFEKWVYYQKGDSIKDSTNRTFWYDPKWSK